MKQVPKTFKYGRVFRKKLKINNFNVNSQLFLTKYNYGFKAIEFGKLNYIHLKMIDLILRRLIKNKKSYKINIGLTTPVTSKPIETRMGKGKGQKDYWECSITKGTLILELKNIKKILLIYIFRLIKIRLPFKIKILKLKY